MSIQNNTTELQAILAAVNALPDAGEGGVNPTGTLEITTNGTHDVTNYASAEVNVPDVPAVTKELSVTENGEYTPDEGVDGFSKVTVNVPSEEPVLQEKTVTKNGEVTPDSGYDGLSKVVVEVPDVPAVVEPLEVTQNGTYTAPQGVDGYSPIVVNVPAENLDAELTEQEASLDSQAQLIAQLQEVLTGKAAGTGDNAALTALVQRTITEFSDDTITEVGSYAFYYCTELASVNLPNVTTINSYAFGGCSTLSNVKFPLAKGVTANCFRGCQSLETADFGKATRFETNAFYNCSALTALIIRTPTVAYMSSAGTVFTGTPIANGTGYIYVPSALIEEYKAATNWSAYADQFRALEDYTVDGTITGALDETKIAA